MSRYDAGLRQTVRRAFGDQIGNRMIHDSASLRFRQETIYRNIHSKEGMRDDLWDLPTHRFACYPRRTREPKRLRDVSILFRPAGSPAIG
mgnify:CR=1 FL=1